MTYRKTLAKQTSEKWMIKFLQEVAMKKSLLIIPFVILLLSATEYSYAQVIQLDKLFHNQILSGNVDSVKSFIKAGVDVNKRFNFGASGSISPLYLAILLGYSEVSKLLIDSGADAKMDFNGWNLMHVAADALGNEAIVELLIKNGLDVNAKTKFYGVTPLFFAARKGNIEATKALIKNGADVNAKHPNYGDTPLHWAVKNQHKDVIKLLISSGAEVNAKNKYKETPLDLAKQKEVADLLKKNGGKSGKE